MKFLSWLFNVNKRHYSDFRRYENGKALTRITYLAVLFIFVGLTIFSLYWSLDVFKNQTFNKFHVIAVLVLFISIGLLFSTVEFCFVMSYIGFKMAICGCVMKKLDNDSNIEQIDNNIKEKNYLVFDIIVGVISLLLALGTIASYFYIISLFLQTNT